MNKPLLSYILISVFVACVIINPAFAFDIPIFEETFEGPPPHNWSADNGVWEIGVPSSGPEECHSGTNCAGTILDDDYPPTTDSHLIGPYSAPWDQGIALPAVGVNEEIHLRFWNWFSYYTYDYGQVQISTFDDTTGNWSGWIDAGSAVSFSSGAWSVKDVDLTAYAGQTVRIGFWHVTRDDSGVDAGWYLDDIQIVKKVPMFTGDFEMGWVDWSADNGVWEVGAPPESGPVECYEGDQCAGTVLGGNYPAYADSRLISATLTLDEITGNEEIHLRFWNWFSYYTYDYGQVQISTFDDTTGNWSSWIDVGSAVSFSSGTWSVKDVDLTAYAGQTVRIGFWHVTRDDSGVDAGWYIDDIQIVKKVPMFTGDFEMGWVDWSADNGVWEVGAPPESGPVKCYEGDQCAGTVLGGNYPAYADSRLVSATIDLSATSLSTVYLSFWEWFSYYSYDYGDVQLSVWDADIEQWSDWESMITSSGTSPVWTQKYVDLSNYSGEILRIGFLHVTRNDSGVNHGWFIDNVELVGPMQIMPAINSISFSGYIPNPCTSLIDVFASDPFDEDLTYVWQLPDGVILESVDDNLEFIPPEIRVEPYQIRVAAWSNVTNLSSFTKSLNIFTEVLYDLDADDDIDGADLRQYVNAGVFDDLERFALEFGLIACQ